MCKVSVVIPVYNAEKYLENTLDSVLDQDFEEYEVICINDESKDASEEILREYSVKDKRLSFYTIVHQGKGAANARNTGLKYAKGDYVIFLDADDFFEKSLLTTLYKRAISANADIVYCDAYIYINETGEIQSPPYLLKKEMIRDEIFSWKTAADYLYLFGSLSPWTHLYKRSFLISNNIEFTSFNYCDDIGFVQKALCLADCISWVPDRLVYWRKGHAESQTTNRGNYPLALMECFYKIKSELTGISGFDASLRSWNNRIVEHLMVYFNTLKNLESAEIFYDEFCANYIDLFGFRYLPSDYFFDFRHRVWIEEMISINKEDYFKRHTYIEMEVQDDLIGKNIVIYGAGNMGKKYMLNCMSNPMANVIAWVDKKSEKIGFPVTGISSLEDLKYDYIVIAVEKQSIREEIVEELLNSGVKENQIAKISFHRIMHM